jgi:hypothetical protein
MGLIRSRAKKLDRKASAAEHKAQTKLLKEQVKQVKQEQDNIQWDEILAAFEAGEMIWDDLSRMQKLQMPIIYQGKCKAAQRRQAEQQTEQEPVRSWDEIFAAFEAGEMTPDDLTRAQWAKMPFGYQVKCRRSAQRQRAAG